MRAEGRENGGLSKCPGMKLTDIKLTDMKMQDMFQVAEYIQGGPKKRTPSFIFGITSVIQHRF